MSLQALQDMLDAARAKKAPAIQRRALDPRLHGYQVEAVQHLWKNPRSALLMQMGLGKTASVLQAITPEHLPVLVIAPKRVAENVWGPERGIWRPDLSIAIAAGNPAKRKAALDSGSDVVVIGRDNIHDVPVGRFRTVVLDELSTYKNKGTGRWKAADKICEQASFVFGLTGTPSPNGLHDLWAQMFLIDGGERLGATLTKFRTRWFNMNRKRVGGGVTVIKWTLKGGSAESQIHAAIDDIALSMRTVDHLDLPPITHNKVMVPIPAKVDRLYNEMTKTLVADLGDHKVASASAGVLTGKLAQVTAGFLYEQDDSSRWTTLHDAKVKAAREIVDGTGSPVLIFYRFKAELEALKAEFKEARLISERGVVQDWNAGEVPVLLAHPDSAGHGLNLQHGGNTIIWTSGSGWNAETFDQANARLARQGQKNPVIIHHLLVPNSVDEAELARVKDKISMQDALLIALRSEEAA